MAPEQISGSNMWKLFGDEYIEGINGRVEGPQRVRVLDFPETNELLIQTEGDRRVRVEGLDFESVVRKR